MRASVLLLLGVLAAGCARKPPPPDLSEAEQAYLDGDYAEAEALYAEAALAGVPEAAAWQGLSLLKLGRQAEAEATLRKALEEVGPLPKALRAQARMGLADSLMSQGRARSAAEAYAALLRDPGALACLDPAQVWYRAGVASLRAGRWEEGRDRFRRVARDWPEHALSDKASDRLADAAERFFAVQLGAFSTPEAAGRMMDLLAGDGIPARQVRISRRGGALYSVRTGRFFSYEAARAELARLKKEKERDGVVVP